MRVLDTKTCQFIEIDPEALTFDENTRKYQTPVYAILSHTWNADGEQTYKQLKKIQQRYASHSQISRGPPEEQEGGTASSPSKQEPDPPPSAVTHPLVQPMLEGRLGTTPPIEALQNDPDGPENEALPPPESSHVPPDSESATTLSCVTRSRPLTPWWMFILLCLAPIMPWWIWTILAWWLWTTGELRK